MLVDDVAMICEGIICKTCVEMDIEIIEIAVNPDHVHIFFKYPPKHSLSYIAKRIKGSTSRILRKEFPHLKEWCENISGHRAVSMDLSGMDGKLWRSIFLSNIPMNTIERNNEDFSYRPRYYFVRGIPVL